MHKEQIKVLHVMDGLGRGGVQTFVMNNIEALSSNGVVFDFLIRRNNSVYDDVINQYNGKVYLMPPFPSHFLQNYCSTKIFFREHAGEYNAIHVHANALLYMLPIKLAMKHSIPIRIIHSHNTKTNVPALNVLHKYNMSIISRYANRFVACGKDAGLWMFGKKQFDIIDNCIDETQFRYSDKNREEIRQLLGIEQNRIVIGHVGSFKKQKNHEFILHIFSEYLKINPTAILLLLGIGVLEEEIKNKAHEMKIDKNVIFAGARGEVYKYYCAMDTFLFPSLFEGLPFTLVESQMSGLHSLVADSITDECIVTDLVHKKSISLSAKEWAEDLQKLIKMKPDRSAYADIVSEAGYGIRTSSKKLMKLYTDVVD